MAFQCHTCLKDFLRREFLVRHLNRKNRCIAPTEYCNPSISTSNDIICEFCGDKFTAKSSLSRHKHHNCKKSPFVMKLVAPITTTATSNITTNTDSHDTITNTVP